MNIDMQRTICYNISVYQGGGIIMYSAMDIARYIVDKCTNDGCPISNLQLQKILYFIQRDYLKKDSQAYSEEIQAWQFGPVVPDVYYRYCGFGAMPIESTYENINIMEDDKKIIDRIVEDKRKLDPWVMVEQTHKPNGAWSKIYGNGLGNHDEIPISLIKTEG